MNKTLITCAVTGNLVKPEQTPHLPITPTQIADECLAAAGKLHDDHPALVRVMTAGALRFFRMASSASDPELPMREWNRASPALRPLSGYAAVHLSNHDCSVASRKRVLALAEAHISFLRPS